jgi:hypothetical protein
VPVIAEKVLLKKVLPDLINEPMNILGNGISLDNGNGPYSL